MAKKMKRPVVKTKSAKKAAVALTPQKAQSERRSDAHVKNKEHKPSFVKAWLVAFGIIAVINVVAKGLMQSVWEAMEVAGVLRGGEPAIAMAWYLLMLLVMAAALTWVVSKASIERPVLFGLVVSLLPSAVEVSTFAFSRVPAVVPLVAVVVNAMSFMLAVPAIKRLVHNS